MAKAKSSNKKQNNSQATTKTSKVAVVRSSRAASALGGFMSFVREQGVVGLAVGLAIGAQASVLVKDMVASLITPIVDLIVGGGGLDGLTWYVHFGNRSTVFNFGLLIDSTIKFLAVAVVIYFVVVGLKLDKLDKKKD